MTFRTSSTADLPNVVHRIAIFDSTSRIVNIISQSDIVRYLLEHRDELGEHGMTSVGELGFGQKEIISVPPEMSAIEALKVMNEKQIGAVGVVNSTGQIIGNFSAADMRYGHTFGSHFSLFPGPSLLSISDLLLYLLESS